MLKGVYYSVKALTADIVFIQETHFDRDGGFPFIKKMYLTAFPLISHSNNRFHHSSQWAIHYLADSIQGLPMILCNVYVPNVAQISFLSKLFSKILGLLPSALKIEGNFNVAFSDIRDKLLLPGKQLSP